MISGLVTTAASMPVDIAKTRFIIIQKSSFCVFNIFNFRIQNMKMVDGKPEYKGAIDVISKVVKNEGFFALWKGFTPYYFRSISTNFFKISRCKTHLLLFKGLDLTLFSLSSY